MLSDTNEFPLISSVRRLKHLKDCYRLSFNAGCCILIYSKNSLAVR